MLPRLLLVITQALLYELTNGCFLRFSACLKSVIDIFLMILTIFSQVKLKEKFFLSNFQNVLPQESSAKGKVLGECRHVSCEKCIRVIISNALKEHTCSVCLSPPLSPAEVETRLLSWSRTNGWLHFPLPLLRKRVDSGSKSLPSPSRLSCILTFYFMLWKSWCLSFFVHLADSEWCF